MMNRKTGAAMPLVQHINQSLADIITTPLGSRVMRRNYGSLVPYLIDQPDNAATQLRLVAAVTAAVMKWEPRVHLTRVSIGHDVQQPGRAEIQLRGRYKIPALPAPQPLKVGVTISGAARA